MDDKRYDLTQDEVSEIRDLYEKKLALENLAKILSPEENKGMYERLVVDYGATVRRFNDWWDKTFQSHQMPAGNYGVDFINSKLVPAQQG